MQRTLIPPREPQPKPARPPLAYFYFKRQIEK